MNRATRHSYTGAVVEHARYAGARIARIMHPPGQRIEAHDHDWPVLTLFRIGSYCEEADGGERMRLDAPSAVVQPAGAAHSDVIGPQGLETLAISFDPDWLEPGARAALPKRTQWRQGGAIGRAICELAQVWLAGGDEAGVRRATSHFLVATADIETPRAPRWGGEVLAALEHASARTDALARTLSRHPAWLARAFRAWRGEGLSESLRRRRVERATLQLRETLEPLAEIAAEAGFCDQAHMNRCFRAVLARTPLDVRREAGLLAPLSPAGA